MRKKNLCCFYYIIIYLQWANLEFYIQDNIQLKRKLGRSVSNFTVPSQTLIGSVDKKMTLEFWQFQIVFDRPVGLPNLQKVFVFVIQSEKEEESLRVTFIIFLTEHFFLFVEFCNKNPDFSFQSQSIFSLPLFISLQFSIQR